MALNTNSSATDQFDRVRNNTSSSVNDQINQKIADQIQHYTNHPADMAQRIQELEREWDTERILEANASVLAFAGLIVGLTVNSNWFWLTGVVLLFLFQHAVQGWCPPLVILRRLGVRTRHEIDQEKYALKALRGDFADVNATDDNSLKIDRALQSVQLARSGGGKLP